MSFIGNTQNLDMKIASKNNTEGWQQSLSMAVRTLPELLKILELNPSNIKGFDPEANEFPLLVPHSFIARMRKGDPKDPLLLQILPQTQENLHIPGFTRNPLLETDFSKTYRTSLKKEFGWSTFPMVVKVTEEVEEFIGGYEDLCYVLEKELASPT